MQHNTHKKPFVHLAYRKIMIDHLPLCDLSHRVKAAAVVLGAPVRVFYSGTARDRQGILLDLTHGGWHEIKVEQHPRQRYFPLIGNEESRTCGSISCSSSQPARKKRGRNKYETARFSLQALPT